jgi:UTP--glucose-1-phosphate uridylyltransferase
MTVRKAVIPAAGLGTRFLPATKAVPKELLPIVDTPTIQYIVEEIALSGLKSVTLISSKGKSSIEDHFDIYPELEEKLKADQKSHLVELLNYPTQLADVISIRQGNPRGLGHAVLCAKEIVGDEPFAVLLGDDLVDSEVPCLKQMIEVYEKHKKSVVALMEVPKEDVSKFGICEGEKISERVIELSSMIEKPDPDKTSSNLAIVGRYILSPKIFKYLEQTDPGQGGEIQLTDAMSALMEDEGFLGYRFIGQRFDAGDKLGYLKANISYALKRADLGPGLKAYLQEILAGENR